MMLRTPLKIDLSLSSAFIFLEYLFSLSLQECSIVGAQLCPQVAQPSKPKHQEDGLDWGGGSADISASSSPRQPLGGDRQVPAWEVCLH